MNIFVDAEEALDMTTAEQDHSNESATIIRAEGLGN
jgi:hypothetical protein